MKRRSDKAFVLNEKKLQEKFYKLFQYKGLSVYDSKHAVEEFQNHFPNLPYEVYLKTLKKGLKKIEKKFGLDEVDNYLIVSFLHGIRIPIEIRYDSKASDRILGVVPTTLAPHEVKKLRNEIEIMVEQRKDVYKKFEVCKGFNYFVQSSKVFTDFEEIILED